MTMNANTNSSRLFQFYMDSFFKFPKDIRNDMIYCQRALRDHIKVHQMVLDVFEAQPNKDTVHRNNILNEIESEIYEINAEQQYLFLRLRRVIEEFYKMLRKNNIPVEQTTTNNLISREVVPFIKKSVLKINPVAVQYRLDEEMLVQKYFEVQQDETTSTGGGGKTGDQNGGGGDGGVCEVIDLCDNDDMDVVEVEPTPAANKTYGKPQSRFKSHQIDNKYVLSQMSLLKPIEQCLVVPGGRMNTQQSDNDVLMISAATADPKIEPQMAEAVKNQETEASKSVKLSRMNLRQALKRAHNVVSSTQPTKEKLLKSPTSGPPSPPGSKKQQNDPKQRTTRATTQAASSAQSTGSSITIDTKTGDLINTSSSDDSNIERDPTSPHPFWPDEMLETRTQPAEYGQEMFLRLFGLFTPEMHVHMQQRRSKRRRRPVQSNERSDFHYGRIEYANFPATKDQKKERKTFLLSPQAKAKKPKRSSAEKIDESSNGPAGTVVSISSSSSSASSRSNTSSPNEKGSCNECLKATGILDSCIACKAYFHQSCHSDETMQVNDDPIKIEDSPSTSEPEKHCPQCKSKQGKMLKKESVQNRTLSDAAKSLEIRMAQQRDRRVQLQNASKMYKLQMMNLFNIVKKLKNDASEGVE